MLLHISKEQSEFRPASKFCEILPESCPRAWGQRSSFKIRDAGACLCFQCQASWLRLWDPFYDMPLNRGLDLSITDVISTSANLMIIHSFNIVENINL